MTPGFSTAGPAERVDSVLPTGFQIARRMGREDATLAHQAGGRMLRVPLSPSDVLGKAFQRLFAHAAAPQLMTVGQRLASLDAIDQGLRRTIETFSQNQNHEGKPLMWGPFDAYLAGIEDFNLDRANPADRVQVLLVFVEPAPTLILESLSTATLRQHGRTYTFESLWSDYVLVQLTVLRQVLRRFVTQASALRGAVGLPAVAAIEILNEPDVSWVPGALVDPTAADRPTADPGGLYVTAPSLSQIPTDDLINRSVEPEAEDFRDQDIQWTGEKSAPTPVPAFRWGGKFDRYVARCARLLRQLSFAARTEIDQSNGTLSIVSGSVSHVNLDYLARLSKADSEVFRYIDKIGVHPYHGPEHDPEGTTFVSDRPMGDWRQVSPREYSRSYFRRFDFLEELRRATLEQDPAANFGLSGKPIWITEFGLPSIRWNAFLGQVDRAYLARNGVEVFLVHTLRDASSTGMENIDFSVYTPEGSPRMEPPTWDRFRKFFASLHQGSSNR